MHQYGWLRLRLDNIFIERLWRSLNKYEDVYLNAYDLWRRPVRWLERYLTS
ncbi:MAG: hypothetical protein R3A44_25940 [Caldilineaceae bacterium]